MFMSGAKLPCPVLFQGTVACTGMGEEHREAAERQKTDRQRWTDRQRGRKKQGKVPAVLRRLLHWPLSPLAPGLHPPPRRPLLAAT